MDRWYEGSERWWGLLFHPSLLKYQNELLISTFRFPTTSSTLRCSVTVCWGISPPHELSALTNHQDGWCYATDFGGGPETYRAEKGVASFVRRRKMKRFMTFNRTYCRHIFPASLGWYIISYLIVSSRSTTVILDKNSCSKSTHGTCYY